MVKGRIMAIQVRAKRVVFIFLLVEDYCLDISGTESFPSLNFDYNPTTFTATNNYSPDE